VRKPNDMAHIHDKKHNERLKQNVDDASAKLLAFPLHLAASKEDEDNRQTAASASDVAEYITEMLESLESLALRNRLEVLGLMIAMAREQANDDSRELGAD
jgi:hypothetical protein